MMVFEVTYLPGPLNLGSRLEIVGWKNGFHEGRLQYPYDIENPSKAIDDASRFMSYYIDRERARLACILSLETPGQTVVVGTAFCPEKRTVSLAG